MQCAPGGDVLARVGVEGTARLWSVSGETTSTVDLYTYLARHWYRLDAATPQDLEWAGGSGFANVPPTSLVGIWQTGGAAAWGRLLAAKEWAGALALRLPNDVAPLAHALRADAQAAAKSNRWQRVDLRLTQLKTLGSPAVTVNTGLQRQRAAFGAAGQPFTNATGMALLWCPPTEGEGFMLGSPTNEPGHDFTENQHLVRLSGYWLGKYELTQPQWTKIMGQNPSAYKKTDDLAGDLPAENLSWFEAMDFCRRLTDYERAAGTLSTGWEYTLPSEAQWEYACLSGAKHTAYSFGEDPNLLYLHGNYNDLTGNFTNSDLAHNNSSKFTARVGFYRPNPWGFYDRHGNVWEWCVDSMDLTNASYSLASDPDPVSKLGALRVLRGGGFYDTAFNCRTSGRYPNVPSNRNGSLGLRPALVRSSSTVRKAGEVAARPSQR